MAEGGQEFFYLDDDGNKQDAELHNAIIAPVDYPIDEKIMAPIRARHRDQHVESHKAKARQLRWIRIKARAEVLMSRGRGNVASLVKIAERADARLERGQNGLYKLWNEDDHPRAPAGGPDGGEFTGGGGSGGESSGRPASAGKPAAGGAQAGGVASAGLPRAFSRESPSDAERSRDVVAIYRPTPAATSAITGRGHVAQTFHELAGASGAKTFQNAISAAKTGTYGASVHVYSADEYAGMRLFLTPDGKDGFALKGDDIVSLFKHPELKAKGVAYTSLMLATEQGGRRLDCFDTQLPKLYSNSGFKAVARVKWNEEYAPPGWDKTTYKEFNGGEPDVVFMVHDPAYGKLYVKGDGKTVAEYDDGSAVQQQSAPDAPSFARAKAIKADWIKASPIKTIDDVKRGAADAQKMLGDAGREIAAQLGGLTFKDPGPKTKTASGVQRVLDKAAERGGNLAAVTDTARGSFLVEHPEQTDQIIAELAKRFDVAPEPWKVTDMNYGDRAVNVRLPNGVIAEVQMMHPDMAKAKSPDGGGGHDLYKISREAAPDGIKPDPAKFADAMAKQRALYGKVYEGLSDDWKAAFGKAGKSG